MCGIFAYLSGDDKTIKYFSSFDDSKHRGPDNSKYEQINNHVCLGFHRLSINDLTTHGNQPFHDIRGIHLVCNGEIYNHKELEQKYNLQPQSKSDCEVIMLLYKKIGIEETIKQLDGVFAFVLYDEAEDTVFVARDPIGVRPLFIGQTSSGEYLFASEVKSIFKHCSVVKQFKPGHFWNSIDRQYISYWKLPDPTMFIQKDDIPLKQINSLLKRAVSKRIHNSERPIGLFLSGGFDSSIVAAIAQYIQQKENKQPLHSFSIGFQDSNDLKFAKQVARKIGSVHHEIRFTVEEAVEAISEVIKSLETYDVTTVRASVPMWLLSRYIGTKTEVRVMLSGEGADEFGSYLYFKDAPNPEEFNKESLRLLHELHKYDVLRTDRSTAAHGLEVRVPFLDKEFMQFFTQIPTQYRMPYKNIEKYYLRKSFEDDNLLPHEVLWRPKDAFSDSVGESWKSCITKHVEKLYTSENLLEATTKYKHLPPLTKEGLWYREIFEKHYGSKCVKLLDKYWMPKWQPETVIDPSATVLAVYKK